MKNLFGSIPPATTAFDREGILDEEVSSIWQRIQTAKKEDKLDEDDKNLSDSELVTSLN